MAGYQLASHDPDGAVSRGYSEGYTDLLGVRREYRGRGIAQALLADAMRRFAAAGMDRASLDVDSENPTGALALYEQDGLRGRQQKHGLGQGTAGAQLTGPAAATQPSTSWR